jgi:hypothetical protein
VTTPLLQEALAAHKADLCVVPPRQDGSKRPIGETWQQWQKRRTSIEQIRAWYSARFRYEGLGAVCGKVSNNLELFEFDERWVYDEYKLTAAELGLGALIERIEDGYLEESPGGGIHWLMRCDEIAGNTVLAQRPKRPEEKRHPKDDWQVLVETRGEGGYAVLAPSGGNVHPSGRPYVRLRGSFATIPVLTVEERQALWDLARTFDQTPDAIPVEPKSAGRAGGSLIDDVNVGMTWSEILESHGWARVHTRGSVTYWRRPGKDRAWSAISGYDDRDLFCNYSTSTGLATKKGYSKFGLYAELNHRGDFKAAAAELGRRGYGEPQTRRSVPVEDLLDAVVPFPVTALPLALRDLVVEGAASIVAPPDFVAVPLLIAAGAAIGGALELELKPGWTEGPNLYGACVGDPGSKKSPAFLLPLRPLNRIQARLRREYKQEKEAYERELAAWEAEKKADRGLRPEAPVFRHVVTTDATTEALAPMLLNSKGLLLFKDELTGWVRGMDMYRSGGKGADRQHYLSMWSRSLIKVDRKSSAEPIIVSRPFLSTFGGIQPDLLPDLADSAQREDGFLDRLLWSYPDPVPDRWTKQGIGPETLQAVELLFDDLQALEPDLDGDGEPVARVIRLSPEAEALWVTWYGQHAAEMADEGFQRRLRGPWAKLPGQLARLTLILHAIASKPLEAEVHPGVLEAAVELLDYFKSHARRAYRQLARARRDRVVLLLEALKKRGSMAQSAILHEVFHRNVSAQWLRSTLDDLEESGLVVREIRQGDAGRPATIWAAT